ncbi:MAG: hypothetical protein ACE5G1_08470 [bacterium]
MAEKTIGINMKTKTVIAGILLAMFPAGEILARDITSLQLMFAAKQAFPDLKEISVLVSQRRFAVEKKNIARAASQTQLKAKVYVVQNALDIGSSLSKVSDGGVLIIFDSDVLSKKKSKLYILSKCKPRQVAIITSSREYAELGALLSIVTDENEKVKMVLNLKHNNQLKTRFTKAVIQKVGISEVIE